MQATTTAAYSAPTPQAMPGYVPSPYATQQPLQQQPYAQHAAAAQPPMAGGM